MIIAVPVWQGRVSPVFDVAGQVLLVEWNDSAEISRREEHLAAESPEQRAELLSRWGVVTLVCCGVSRPMEIILAARGIKVVPQVCGPVEEVLQALLAGNIHSERFAMPGCCNRGRGRGMGRGQGRGRGRCRRGGRGFME